MVAVDWFSWQWCPQSDAVFAPLSLRLCGLVVKRQQSCRVRHVEMECMCLRPARCPPPRDAVSVAALTASPSSPCVSLPAPQGWRGCSGSLYPEREDPSWAPSASFSPLPTPLELWPPISIASHPSEETWMPSGCRLSSRRSSTHPVSQCVCVCLCEGISIRVILVPFILSYIYFIFTLLIMFSTSCFTCKAS